MPNSVEKIFIPEAFCKAPFYENGDFITMNEKDGCQDPPFLFDLLFSQNYIIQGQWPWESPHKIKQYFEYWKVKEKELSDYFRRRQKKMTVPMMRQFIAYFIDIVYWSHEARVLTLKEISKDIIRFEYIPVNVGERLQFILDQPAHHLSFIQLKELFYEQEKKLVKARAIRKRKN